MIDLSKMKWKVDYAAGAPDEYRCEMCGAHGVKLWREYNTFLSNQTLECARCAGKSQNKDVRHIGADGKYDDDGIRTDQIGWRIPAIPTEDGDTFWGYSSVPPAGVAWWRRLPTWLLRNDADVFEAVQEGRMTPAEGGDAIVAGRSSTAANEPPEVDDETFALIFGRNVEPDQPESIAAAWLARNAAGTYADNPHNAVRLTALLEVAKSAGRESGIEEAAKLADMVEGDERYPSQVKAMARVLARHIRALAKK